MLSFEQIKKLVISKVGFAHPEKVRDEAITYLKNKTCNDDYLLGYIDNIISTKNNKKFLDEKVYDIIVDQILGTLRIKKHICLQKLCDKMN